MSSNFFKVWQIVSLCTLITVFSCSEEETPRESIVFQQTGEIRAGAFDEVKLTIKGFTSEDQLLVNGQPVEVDFWAGDEIAFEVPYQVGSGRIEVTNTHETISGPQFIYEESYVGFLNTSILGVSMTGTHSNSVVTYDPIYHYFNKLEFSEVRPGEYAELVLTTTRYTATVPNSTLATWSIGKSLGMCANANDEIYFAQFYRKEAGKDAVHTPLLVNMFLDSPSGNIYEDAGALYDEVIDIEVNAAEELFTAENGKPYIRKNTLTEVSTFVGSAVAGHKDGTGTAAQFSSISAMTIDNIGNLYVADGNCIRKVTPAGEVTTIAGSTESGNIDGVATQARFNKIIGIFWKNDGTLYISDNGNNVIKTLKSGMVTTLRDTQAPAADLAVNVPLYVDSNNIIYTMGGRYSSLIAFIPENLASEAILEQGKNMSGYLQVDLQN